jgi:glycosyltransferase involved in cell wall biosynthesis
MVDFNTVGASPAVTVLMGVYNAPLRMLDEAIDSILQQTFRDFEFLIVDDGSDDLEVRAHVARRAANDSRMRIAWEPHRGLTPSLNKGLEIARGRFVARQDADDWSDPERLAFQASYLETHPETALCGSNAWTHQQDGRKLWRVRLPLTHDAITAAFPSGNPFVHGSVMFRKQAADAVGGYRECFRCSQDYDFFWRLSEQFQTVNLPQPLYHYRYTKGSISAGRATEQLHAHNTIQRLARARFNGSTEDPIAELDRVAQELNAGSGIYRALLKQADHLMLAGEYRGAAKAYFKLLGAHPASRVAWGKLARLGIFMVAPLLREATFQ